MEKIELAPKEVLVDIVKMSQKRGMTGSNGDWKEFLTVYDKKLGKSLSDPAKRSPADLIAFLKTFTNEGDLKFFAKMVEMRDSAEVIDKGTDPEQLSSLVFLFIF
ncbi:small RNA degrading nuclease 3-like [Bidens hawaiensis]|uniref:small RNA degrading nuclease 3-like n=1 Tax=Bidens hawaiensis TaxID=980011 RepID=UPI00404A09AE